MTQEARGRTMACTMLLVGHDDDRGAQAYKIDLAGHFLPYKACAMGKYEAEAMNYLEKRVDGLKDLDENGAIEMAISTMQYILSTDFKSGELEVGVVSGGKRVRMLGEEEIEDRLNAITEKAEG